MTYDHDAAAGGVAYGDPWQLVSVFDGDDATNVVCGGYAKAFKYLCDLADMDGIECRLAMGPMAGGTGAGNHMWNVVEMDDGLNYLVDVTNCDEGTIGADDLLFLVPYATGSVDEGYTFEPDGESISYAYGNETRRYFATDELTLSSTPYNKETASEPTEGWTAFGGCEWRIEGDTMTIRLLHDGVTGTLADTAGYPMPGVNDPAVRHIVFSDGVRAADNMVSLFDGATNLETIGFGDFDTSKCTNMAGMFGSCSSLTELDLSGFDTSNVEYMFDMFGGCSKLEDVDLSSFDTHLVTDMSTMFRYCSSLTELDLSHFDTTSVANFYDMFWDCTSLATLDISSFDPTHGHAWSNMFHNCASLAELTVGESWRFYVDTMMAEPTNERGWYSTTDKKWYSKDEIMSSRSGVADTYVNWAPKTKLDGAKVELAEESYVYAGNPIEPVASVSVGDVTLTKDVDYTVSYEGNVNAGQASYVIEGIGDFEGSCEGGFQVEPREVTLTSASASKVYDWTALVAHSVEVTGKGFVSGEGADYTFTGSQTKVGGSQNTFTYQLTDATLASNYDINVVYGTLAVEKGAQTITASNKSLVFGGTVSLGAKSSGDGGLTYQSANSSIATVDASGNVTGKAKGTAKITITADTTECYNEATKTVTVTVTAADVSKAAVAAIAEQAYTGSAIKPVPAVKVGSATLKSGTDYTLSYKNNTAVGTATVTVTGKGNYTGTKSATFKIVNWSGANRIPVSAKATYTLLKGGYMRVLVNGRRATSDAYVSISGATITGKKAGKTVVYLYDKAGKQLARKTVEAYSIHGKYFEMESSVDRNYVLDIQGGSTKDGAQMIVYKRKTSGNTDNQIYRYLLQSDGTYRIVSKKSGRCLTVDSMTNKYVQQWAWKGTNAQRWRLTIDSSNRVTFVNVYTNKCFDVQGGKTTNSAKMIVWQSNGGLNQKWKLNKK